MVEYSIKQVAQQTNLTPYTLRYYEKEGLIPSVDRDKGGRRRFTQENLEWIGLICCLKSTGMSVKQIREFVDLNRMGDCTLAQRCEMLVEHKRNMEVEIEMMHEYLEKVEHKIQHMLEKQKYAKIEEVQ